MTRVPDTNVVGDLSVDWQTVVDKKLIAGCDRGELINEYRSPVSMASQLGEQPWFRKRALLPPRLPSTTRPSDRPNTNVRPAWSAEGRRRAAS
jgi:hypothetical protein